MSKIKYRNPPLVEVAFSIQFEELSKLKSPHLGELWKKFDRKNFPKIEEKLPLGKINSGQQQTNFTQQLSLLPRIWYINDTQTSLIQVQRDRFCYNWRKKIEDENNVYYPHYESNVGEFFKYFAIFQEFLKKEDLGEIKPEMAELTYVNHIDYNDILEINDIFKDFNWLKREKNPEDFLHNITFNIKENLSKAYIEIATAQRAYDGKQVYKTQLSVRGQLQEINAENIRNWYDKNHEWITSEFNDLVTDKIKTKWGAYESK